MYKFLIVRVWWSKFYLVWPEKVMVWCNICDEEKIMRFFERFVVLCNSYSILPFCINFWHNGFFFFYIRDFSRLSFFKSICVLIFLLPIFTFFLNINHIWHSSLQSKIKYDIIFSIFGFLVPGIELNVKI